eukprot:3579367-Pyramimonas_sp.AAC.1
MDQSDAGSAGIFSRRYIKQKDIQRINNQYRERCRPVVHCCVDDPTVYARSGLEIGRKVTFHRRDPHYILPHFEERVIWTRRKDRGSTQTCIVRTKQGILQWQKGLNKSVFPAGCSRRAEF